MYWRLAKYDDEGRRIWAMDHLFKNLWAAKAARDALNEDIEVPDYYAVLPSTHDLSGEHL